MEQNGKQKEEKPKPDTKQVDEELLLKQITDLVINERLLSGKSHIEDKIIHFIHPEELKVAICLYFFVFAFFFSKTSFRNRG